MTGCAFWWPTCRLLLPLPPPLLMVTIGLLIPPAGMLLRQPAAAAAAGRAATARGALAGAEHAHCRLSPRPAVAAHVRAGACCSPTAGRAGSGRLQPADGRHACHRIRFCGSLRPGGSRRGWRSGSCWRGSSSSGSSRRPSGGHSSRPPGPACRRSSCRRGGAGAGSRGGAPQAAGAGCCQRSAGRGTAGGCRRRGGAGLGARGVRLGSAALSNGGRAAPPCEALLRLAAGCSATLRSQLPSDLRLKSFWHAFLAAYPCAAVPTALDRFVGGPLPLRKFKTGSPCAKSPHGRTR